MKTQLLSRWLLAVGRRSEAEAILSRAAEENRKSENKKPTNESLKPTKTEEGGEEDGRKEGKAGKGEVESRGNVFDLFKTFHLCKSTLIM